MRPTIDLHHPPSISLCRRHGGAMSMRTRVRSICGSLTAVLFLGASASAPPVRHAHSMSTVTGSDAVHVHQHKGAHTHPHVHHPRRTSLADSRHVSHYHLAWLWIDFSIPDPVSGHGPLDTRYRLPPTVAAPVCADFSPVTTLQLPPLWSAADDFLSSVPRQSVSRDGLKTPLGGLLSDAARRERTGVRIV